MNIIVVVDKHWGIGRHNDLLFHLPEDMAFFRSQTTGKIIVMGARTLQSFPGGRPLKNRTNIVLTSSTSPQEGVIAVRTLGELLQTIAAYPPEDVFVVGGARLYETLLPYAARALVTRVDADGGAEVFFPNLDEAKDWRLVAEGEPLPSNGYTIRFTTYENQNIKPLNG